MAVSHGHLAACFRGYASPVDPSAHYSRRLRLCPSRSSSLGDARVKDKTRPRRRAAGSESESAASATEAAHWPFGVNSIMTWIMGPLFLKVGSLSILVHPPAARCDIASEPSAGARVPIMILMRPEFESCPLFLFSVPAGSRARLRVAGLGVGVMVMVPFVPPLMILLS